MYDPTQTVAKVLGADFELANSFIGNPAGSARQAACGLLAEIVGYPRGNRGGTTIEYGRRFLDSCGSSWYIDSDHLEGNLPEHTSAWDHPAVLYGAGFGQALVALRGAQSRLPAGTRLNLLANCSDGNTAWGSHLNVMVTRKCFDDLSCRKPHLAGFFATHLVTSVPYTGQGLVGAANRRAACDYQLSQRADWFEKFFGQQTMFERPLINLRDEPHADDELARLHVIFYDMVLSPTANILKAGTTQLLLAMIEAGWADPTLCLDDPVAAASEVSRDLHLRKKLPTAVRGRAMTAVEIQQALANLAGEFVATGAAEGIVPGAEQIVALWLETLDLLARHEVEGLARRCDAWLKYLLLDRQRGRRNLSWSSDELRVADSLFASIDPDVSLYFQAAGGGFVERMPGDDAVERFAFEPPDETRAYFRAHVLRRYGETVSSIDWSRITFRVPGARHWWSYAEIPMRDPRRFNRADSEALLEECATLEELVEAANTLTQDRAVVTSVGGAGR
jgi:proteasome accessory factor A